MPEVLLGLDIGSRNIKAVLLERGRRNRVVGAQVIKTPDGSVSDGAIMFNMDAIVECVRAYVVKAGVRPAGLGVCMNSPDIITRNLSLPPLGAEEIPAAVKFEVFKFFPSIKETHEITQTVLSKDDSSVSVLAALCPRELIKSYQELASRLGIPLKRVSIRADAENKAVNFFYFGGLPEPEEEKKTGAAGLLVDVGYRNSIVSVVNLGKLILSRYTMSGSAAYDGMIAEKAGVTRDEIEKGRLDGSLSAVDIDPVTVENVMGMCFIDIDDQIRQTIGLYTGSGPDEKLAYVSVTGEGGMIPGIEQYFARSHNLTARDIKPVNAERTGYAVLQGSGNPKLLLAAAGAVLSVGGPSDYDMNFAPPSVVGAGVRKGAGFGRLASALSAAVALAIILVATGVYFMNDRRHSHDEITQINLEITQDMQTAVQNEAIARAQKQLADLTSVLYAVDRSSAKASELLDDLASRMPENLFVTNFNMPDANNVVLTGRSKDFADVSEFALLLRETGKYDSVRINTVTANQTASETVSDYGFSLTVIIKAGY